MIDVSEFQGTIDWVTAHKGGVERAYIKLSQGHPGERLRIDPFAVANIHHARAAGVQVGVYHFAEPQNDPEKEARLFLRYAQSHFVPGDLPPALDLETFEGHTLEYLAHWKAEFFKPVDERIQTRATFYSFRSMLDFMYQHLYSDRPIWGAHPATIEPREETRWAFWQYGQGRVLGVRGIVDLDKVLHPSGNIPTIPAL